MFIKGKGCTTITCPDQVYLPSGPSRTVDLEELYVDPLTGLGNLFSCLVELDTYCARGGSVSDPFFLALVDVDALGTANERMGSSTSDQLLLLTKTSMLDTLGTQGKVFRFALDSFAAVGKASLEGLDQLSHELAETFFDRCVDVLGTEGSFTLSIGGSVVTHGCSLGEVILSANRALHEARDQGGNSVKIRSLPPSRAGDRESPAGSMLSVFGRQILDTLNIVVDVGEMAMTDPLTGLPNQRAAELHLRKMLTSGNGDTLPLSVLLIDGDRLKEHNTRYGYSGGNVMMKKLAETLQDSKRSSDFLARWFVGDEFLVALPGTDGDSAKQVAERMRRKVRDVTRDWDLPITISIGTATSPDDGDRIADLITVAQQACLVAKERGKDTVVSSAELDKGDGTSRPNHPGG